MKKTMTFIFLLAVFSVAYAVTDKVLEQWQKTMNYGISTQRSGVIDAIEKTKSTNAYYLIELAMTNDENETVRGKAVYTLINLKVSNDKLWNDALLKETKPEVLRKLAFGVNELKIKSASPRLLELLNLYITNQKENMLTSTLMRSLGELEYKAANPALINILTNIEYAEDVRASAALALGYVMDSSLIPLLESIVKNPGEPRVVRMYSAFAIGKTGDPKAMEILLPIVDDELEDLNIRLWAVAGLSYVKDNSIFGKFLSYARQDNVRIRLEAIKALARFNNKEAIEILTFKALYDTEGSVKIEAKKALQSLGVDVENLGKDTNQIRATNAVATNR